MGKMEDTMSEEVQPTGTYQEYVDQPYPGPQQYSQVYTAADHYPNYYSPVPQYQQPYWPQQQFPAYQSTPGYPLNAYSQEFVPRQQMDYQSNQVIYQNQSDNYPRNYRPRGYSRGNYPNQDYYGHRDFYGPEPTGETDMLNYGQGRGRGGYKPRGYSHQRQQYSRRRNKENYGDEVEGAVSSESGVKLKSGDVTEHNTESNSDVAEAVINDKKSDGSVNSSLVDNESTVYGSRPKQFSGKTSYRNSYQYGNTRQGRNRKNFDDEHKENLNVVTHSKNENDERVDISSARNTDKYVNQRKVRENESHRNYNSGPTSRPDTENKVFDLEYVNQQLESRESNRNNSASISRSGQQNVRGERKDYKSSKVVDEMRKKDVAGKNEGRSTPEQKEKFGDGSRDRKEGGAGRRPGPYAYYQRNKGPRKQMDESQRGVLIEQLTRGTYECMICCDTIRGKNAVWSCGNCYHVFHLRCIKQWAKSPNAVVTGPDKNGWRCPGCQNITYMFPSQYRCFCGKLRDPDWNRVDTPHSCGEVCNKDRGEGCPHRCVILCHPGPCPPCGSMITKSCDCGKTKMTVKCGQGAQLKCNNTCGKVLNCGKHECQDMCHVGSCEKCQEILKQECYGEHESREVVCGSVESFTECYSCGEICSRKLACGNHYCDKECHMGACEECALLPSNVTTCPCGATQLADLVFAERTSCLDPIATCGETCNKELPCGPPDAKHRCKEKCHEGKCGPCLDTTELTCRCGALEKNFDCQEVARFTEDKPFLCDKRCNRKRTCGRHKCGQLCCVNTEHPCDLICGKKLECGLHKCDEPCHRGNCPPCLMASFDELTCYCGTEVLFPPIPCATRPPECHKTCTRPHPCDHEVRHNCHSDEACPPCTQLTQKMCMGNHELRKNIPCHLTDISCGLKCGKPLPCGLHTCQKICHKGACMSEGEKCTQPCCRKKTECDHACRAPCHQGEDCPKIPCRAEVVVKCPCGNREAKTICGLGGSPTMEAAEYQRMAMQNYASAMQFGCSSIDLTQMNKKKSGKELECNEECAKMERNKRLALALEIQNPDLKAKLGNPTYNDFLKDYARQNQHFVASIEKALSDLVQLAKQSKQPHRSHPFPNMNRDQRRAIHELAEFYGCETQAYDFEPKKNVVATAYRDKCWLPSVTLTSLVQRELHPRAPLPIPHIHNEGELRQYAQAAKQSTDVMGKDKGKSTDGWHTVATRKLKKGTETPAKSAATTIDWFDGPGEEISASKKPGSNIDYFSLSKASKEALKSEPVVDYFDFTVNM